MNICSNQGANKMTCNHCGKTGHKWVDCWQQDKNKDKRPNNYKTNLGKHGQANMSQGKDKG
jgi:hypothetical protein